MDFFEIFSESLGLANNLFELYKYYNKKYIYILWGPVGHQSIHNIKQKHQGE